MATAYVAHEQMKMNRDTGERFVRYDTSAADEFGLRRVVFKHGDHQKTPAEQISVAREALKDATENDWLVYSGAPDLVVAAALVFAEATGGSVNLLIYDRDTGRYDPRRYSLKEQKE